MPRSSRYLNVSAGLLAALLLAACSPQSQPEQPATQTATANDAAPAEASTPASAPEVVIDESILTAEASADNPQSSTEIPEAFRGQWEESAASCNDPSDARLVLTANELRYSEATARVELVQLAGNNSIILRARSTAEDQPQLVEHFALSEDGKELYDNGQTPAFAWVRCQ